MPDLPKLILRFSASVHLKHPKYVCWTLFWYRELPDSAWKSQSYSLQSMALEQFTRDFTLYFGHGSRNIPTIHLLVVAETVAHQ